MAKHLGILGYSLISQICALSFSILRNDDDFPHSISSTLAVLLRHDVGRLGYQQQNNRNFPIYGLSQKVSLLPREMVVEVPCLGDVHGPYTRVLCAQIGSYHLLYPQILPLLSLYQLPYYMLRPILFWDFQLYNELYVQVSQFLIHLACLSLLIYMFSFTQSLLPLTLFFSF